MTVSTTEQGTNNGLVSQRHRRLYEIFSRISMRPVSIIEIESSSISTDRLEDFIRESFELSGIDLSQEEGLLYRDPNYYTVTLYNEEYGINIDGQVIDAKPQMIYQVGVYEDIGQIPLLAQDRYIIASGGEGEIAEHIKDSYGVDSNTSIKSAYVTRLGTNRVMRNLTRNSRRMKLAQWMRDSIGKVTEYPPIQDVELVFFETTRSRAKTFEIAIGKPVNSMYDKGVVFNREAYPIDAIVTDDYVIRKERDNQDVKERMDLLRDDLRKFLRGRVYATHTEVKDPNTQQVLWSDFLMEYPEHDRFSQEYFSSLSEDRAGIYWFVMRSSGR
ncbi:hypothetical protein GF389_01290 [Candidatus Dojkabacteria bacterium]|nr:hypothetical protein [Candidatus Dojkabacteria bacterium]